MRDGSEGGREGWRERRREGVAALQEFLLRDGLLIPSV